MLYRIQVDLAFTEENFQESIKNHILGVFKHAVTINPESEHPQHGTLQTHTCNHEEAHHLSCDLTFYKETP